MDSGLYAACAGLVARTQQLDTIASNLANASSAGFRGQKNVFGTVLAEASHRGSLSALNAATNSYGVLSGTELDEAQGAITATGNPLDIALEGPGYLKVQTRNGVAYTRNGSLQISSSSQLTTATGDPILGQSGPITVAKGAITISPDGSISSGGTISGKLAIVTFKAPAIPVSRGNGYYGADAKAEVAATSTGVKQGSLESANVSSVDGVVELITAQRAAESMRHVLTMLDSEMDKTAVQDLPRVSAAS